MWSEELKQYAREQYQKRIPYFGKRRREIQEKIKEIPEEERILMEFLYGTMPIQDVGECGPEIFLGFVRHGIMLRKQMEWCRNIPEAMFLHYVLYHRINTENIEDCREIFYDCLKDRIKGMSDQEAALEINYWCAEQGSYESTDDRTMSPLTFLRGGRGRCGEESVFAVTAFRSVGIPARQVYTPRWAHCDDNHAWVEVFVQGAWHFLGACEPEEILDKGWFTNASSRAMLVHTRTFSAYSENEQDGRGENPPEILEGDGLQVFYNDTANYAVARRLQILVTDEKDRPVPGAEISAEILNMAEFSPAARLTAGPDGRAWLTLGLGDILISAVKGERWAEEIASVNRTDQITLKLGAEGTAPECTGEWKEFQMEAPKDYPVHPAVLTGEQKEKNRRRLSHAACCRREKQQSWIQEELWKDYPEEKEIFVQAGGNVGEIAAFLTRDKDPARKALLHHLSRKDMKDGRAEILESHLKGAAVFQREWQEKGEEEIFFRYIQCPRIFYETLTDYRGAVQEFFSQEEKEAFRRQPELIWKYIQDNLTWHPDLDYSSIYSTPKGSLMLGQASPLSQRILFVAICRTLGIPARMNPVDREGEIYENGIFRTITAEKAEKDSGENKPARAVFLAEGEEPWKYYQTWTLGRFKDNRFDTLDYSGEEFQEGKLVLSLAPGIYRVITTRRLPGGGQLAAYHIFRAEEGREVRIPMYLRKGELKEQLVDYVLEDFMAETEEGENVPVSCLLNGTVNLLALLAEGQEPTEHVLNEMLEQKEELENLDGQMVFLVEGRESLTNPLVAAVKTALPKTRFVFGRVEELAEPLARRMYVDPEKLPLLIACGPGLHGFYGSSGYNVGSVNLLLRLGRLYAGK